MIDLFRELASLLGLTWLSLLGLTGWCLAHRKWRVASLTASGFLAITVIGNTPLATRLLASLEKPYARTTWADLPAADAVVMLGGTHKPSRLDVFGFDLVDAADRIVTATELVRQRRAPLLVLSSGGYEENGQILAGAPLIERWLKAWGVPGATVMNLGACRDTRDEAARTLALLRERRWQKVILVTSANHLRRAEGVFRKTGVPVVSVGCDFQGHAALQYETAWSLTPRPERFHRLNQWVHEQIGWYYYRLRGWI